MTLPALVVVAILALNTAWAVWVADGKVHNQLLLGLLPKPIAAALLGGTAIAVAIFAAFKTRLFSHARNLLRTNGLMIAGALLGATPAAIYAAQAALGFRTMEPSVPLGFKPLWMAGDTMHYLIRGLPQLVAADIRPYLQLVTVGRESPVSLLNIENSAAVIAANWLVVGALLTSLIVFISQYRKPLSDMFSLKARPHPPALLLVLGLCGMVVLYVIGSCSFNFTTIRYLVPLWAFLPGLLAAVFVSRQFRFAARIAPLCACLAWGVGQVAMYSQLGNPHPLRNLANAVTARGVDPACAEILDAHLLSYLTDQQCRVAEFDPFWPRLTHYRPLFAEDRQTNYIVNTREIDRTEDWIRGGWPGTPPPETQRLLWPRIRRAITADPALLVSREHLAGPFELIRLRQRLNLDPSVETTSGQPDRIAEGQSNATQEL